MNHRGLRILSNGSKSGKGLKIALVLVSAVLIVSVIFNVYLYSQQHGISEDGGLEGQIADLQNQVSALQNDVNSLKAAKLVTRLGASDNRPLLGSKSLFVQGSIWNVGTNPAQNCKLHVVLYQGQTVAKDTYINLGTINGETYTEISENVYYEGSSLSDWTITPEWE